MTGSIQVYDGTGRHIPPLNCRKSPDGLLVGLQIRPNRKRGEFYPEKMINALGITYDQDGRPRSHAWAWFNPGGLGWDRGWRTGCGFCVREVDGGFVPFGWWQFEGIDGQVSKGFLNAKTERDGLWYDALFVEGQLSRKATKYDNDNASFSHNWTETFQPSPDFSLHLAVRAVGEDNIAGGIFPPDQSSNPFINIPDDVIANLIVQKRK